MLKPSLPSNQISRLSIVHLILILILGVSAFLRFYRLPDLYNFLGDQGRDAIIANDILTFTNFPAVGPGSSAGDFFMGPFYYYFVALGLGLAGFNPIGPVILVALISVLTTGLLYFIFARYLHSRSTGLVAAYLFAISPVVVYSARFSWNPNLIPLFTLTLLIGFLEFIKTAKTRWLFLSALSLAILLQLHYLAFLFIPIVVLFFFARRQQFKLRHIIVYWLIIGLSFLPLALFDLTHSFVNYRGLTQFFTDMVFESVNGAVGEKLPIQINPFLRYNALWSLYLKNVVAVGVGSIILAVVSVFTLLGVIKELCSNNITPVQRGFLRFVIYWWLLGFTLYLLYRGAIYPYHYTIFFTLAAVIIALSWWLFVRWMPGASYRHLRSTLLVLCLTLFTYKAAPVHLQALSQVGNLKISIIERAVDTVADQAGNQPFNFALISKNNYDSAYRYFFMRKKLPVEYTNTVTDQLFVVCEDIRNCQIEGNPKWEIAIFDAAYHGRIQRVSQASIDDVVEVIKLKGVQ